ncbi:FtsX-like permease family protein [Pedobacter sp. LMG 31464]|uniref:FtsX-like permease family protein n=1 Tax=Pedobacter planticolens TaxID=2679964 RepID=A0A923IUN3_9SPHI|nr:ABC transporter permease [Pedobacter planticolens]MBB2144344.1 FtsX-like permease family protein [Pedobacter planticolens]
MFKLNLKIALRNLFKNKVYAAINIGGLALGLTAFVLLLLFINHETNYDKWNPDLDKVYQIREHHDSFTPDNQQHWMESVESRVGALVTNKVPQFKQVTKVGISWGDGYSVKLANADPILIKDIRDADSLFFKVFPYKFVQGDQLTAISTPNTIVLKRSVALKLFGTEKVLGKQLKLLMWRTDEGRMVTVTGVVEDPSTPQSVNFNAILHSGEREQDPDQISNTNHCEVYALAAQKLDTTAVNKVLQKVYVDYKKRTIVDQKGIDFKDYYKNGKTPGLKIVPLQEVYSTPSLTPSWLDKIKPIIALSIFLLLVSIINFVNLSTAQSVQRAKEVGVKKVLGAYKKQLVIQFLLESAIQTLASLFICVILVEILLPAFSNQFDVQLSFWHSKQLLSMLFQLVGLFIFITLLAGFYPAWMLSKYNPVKVLKGNYENGFKGIALRNGLVIVQFIIAVTFIIGIGVMQQQTSYVANKDLGFNRDKLINISTNYNDGDPFGERVKRVTGVKYVATTTQVMGNTFNFSNEITFNNQKYDLNTVTVTMDALPALGVQVVKGRIFSRAYGQDTINSVVINQSAERLLGKNMVGKQYKTFKGTNVFQVVGVIKDYNNEGFDKAVLPTIYKVTHLGGSSNTNNLLIRFESENYKPAMKAIEGIWKELYPAFPMRYIAVEDAFQNELKATRRQMQIIVLFSVISVILSLLGLFALSAFIAKRKTKEIAIRKILGASNFQVINMLNRSFLILVIIANLISWPIAFILTRKWLEGFAYRIDMPIWPFLMATLLSVVIAVFTVSLQARKAAVNNPVDALKYE